MSPNHTFVLQKVKFDKNLSKSFPFSTSVIPLFFLVGVESNRTLHWNLVCCNSHRAHKMNWWARFGPWALVYICGAKKHHYHVNKWTVKELFVIHRLNCIRWLPPDLTTYGLVCGKVYSKQELIELLKYTGLPLFVHLHVFSSEWSPRWWEHHIPLLGAGFSHTG